MAILSWIVFGLVVGFIAKLLMPGRDPGGFVVTMLLGIAGSLIGGFIGRAFTGSSPGQSAGSRLHHVDCRRDHPAGAVPHDGSPPRITAQSAATLL